MTIFSNDEEAWAEKNILHGEEVPFYPAEALKAAGGDVQTKGLFEPNAVQDRELTTGQNPFSDGPFTELFLKAIGEYAERKAA
jgi:putative intracellular protease/amidase